MQIKSLIEAALGVLLLLTGCTATDDDINARVLDSTAFAGKVEHHAPIYRQLDNRWADLEYGESTIGEAGCGLVAAACAIEYLTGETTLPLDLYERVGSSCLTAGVNDPGKFGDYITSHYSSIQVSPQVWRLDVALGAIDNAEVSCALAGVTGYVGERYYTGHVLMLFKFDGLYYLRDSASVENSQRPWTLEELEQIEWLYFYILKGE